MDISKYRCVSGSTLKVIAIATMLIDHTAKHVLAYVPFARHHLFTLGSHDVNLLYIMVSIGRIAFPIFAYLIVEGYIHTHDRKAYGRNLLLFALLSEIPWNLIHTGTLFYNRQNVFFTLFLGYLGIWCIDHFRHSIKRQAVSLLSLLLASFLLRADYSCTGVALILMTYTLRNNKLLMSVIGTGLFSSTWRSGLAYIPICMYNGKRGFIQGSTLKYAFYAFYPLHLLILYFIRLSLLSH